MSDSNFVENGFMLTSEGLSEEVVRLKERLNRKLMETAIFIANKLDPSLRIDPHHSNIGDLLSQIHAQEKSNEISSACYQVFPTLPDVISLPNNPLIVNLCSQSGLKNPQVGTVPLIRIDRPGETLRMTPWHQDFWFSFLSNRSIVMWMPLDLITEEMGWLKIIPRSHQLGVVPFRENKNGVEPFEPEINFDECLEVVKLPVKYSEILILNQKVLHKSGFNKSEKIRVSLQLRFNDLDDAKEMTSTFNVSHSAYTKRMQLEYFKKS